MRSKSSLKYALARWFFFQNASDRRHIDRWKHNPCTEQDWEKIEKSAWRAGRSVEAEEFIRTVLSARHWDESIRSENFDRKQTEIFMALKRRISKDIPKLARSAQYPFALASALEKAAMELRGAFGVVISSKLIEPRAVARDSQQQGPGLLIVIQSPPSLNGRLRPHTIFMNAVSNYLFVRCGRRLDQQVATLTDIAFNVRDTSIDKVRSASARRPTTKAGRAKKR
jgi:hypothetical protein